MKLFTVGDTTYSSDPKGRHKSHTVFTTETGKKFYARVDGFWYYAYPVPPTGFRVGKRVPRNVVATLGKESRSSNQRRNPMRIDKVGTPLDRIRKPLVRRVRTPLDRIKTIL